MKLLILIFSMFLFSHAYADAEKEQKEQIEKRMAENNAKMEKCNAEMAITCKNISRKVCLETKTFSDNCNALFGAEDSLKGILGGCKVKMKDFCKIQKRVTGGPSFEVRMAKYEACIEENKEAILKSCPDAIKTIEKASTK